MERFLRLLCVLAALLLCNPAFGATYFSIETIAGTGTAGFSGDGGLATLAQLNDPASVSVDASGNIYVADVFNCRIRLITPSGVISTIAGNGTCGFSGDGGNGTDAQLNYPSSAVPDGFGNLYIADKDNHRVRKVSPGGIITTIGGTGVAGLSGDGGLATLAQLYLPYQVAVDGVGNVYIEDRGNNRIRKILPDGTIQTVAVFGTPPGGIALSTAGDLYIADGTQIFKLLAGGGLVVIAGTGEKGFVGGEGDEGPATSAQFYSPNGISLDNSGNLYITDLSRVRMVSGDGVISTVAGTGGGPFSGDGAPAIGANVAPSGVWAGGAGRVYVADVGNNRIRRLVPATPPTLSVSTNVLSFTSFPQVTRQPVSVAGSSLLRFSATASTNSGGSWLAVGFTTTGQSGFLFPAVGVLAPQTLYIEVDARGVPAGTHTGTVTITSSSASNSPQTVAVTLTVPPAQLVVSPPSLSFLYLMGSPPPSGQSITVTSSGGAANVTAQASTASGGSWLSVVPGGTTSVITPAFLQVMVVPLGMSPGTYNGTITISSPDATNSPQTVPVTLNISPAYLLTLNQSSLNFYQTGATLPGDQTVSVGSSGAPLAFTASVSTEVGEPWLAVSPINGLTPSNLNVSIRPFGLNPGTYHRTIMVSSTGAVNSPQLVPVTLTVQAACAYTVSPGASAVASAGGIGSITVTASSSLCPWTAVSNDGWITVTPGSFGLGSGTVGYSVAANSGASRAGSLTVAGQTFTITQQGQNVPSPVSLNSVSGSGATHTFVFTFSDPNGWQDLSVLNVLLNSALDARNACYLAYDRPSNILYVVGDNGGGLTGLVLNGSGSVNNSQCKVNGVGSSASGNGNTLTLTLSLSFNQIAFGGEKITYLAARDIAQNNSGWRTMGVWSVPALAPVFPSIMSMTPSEGGAATQQFVVTYRDVSSSANLRATQLLLNSELNANLACYLGYDHVSNLLYLVSDNNGGLLIPGIIPNSGSGTVENGQCAINGTGTTKSESGRDLTLSISLTFKSSFAGPKLAYTGTQTISNVNSGWHVLGFWDVPGN